MKNTYFWIALYSAVTGTIALVLKLSRLFQ